MSKVRSVMGAGFAAFLLLVLSAGCSSGPSQSPEKVIKNFIGKHISMIDPSVADYYVSKEAAIQALNDNSTFNIIDIQTGWKADLIIRKKRAYSKQEFSRKTNTTLMGMSLWILSPEDSILSKLEWSKGRETQIQFKDALGVIMVQWNNLDFDYLKKWAKELQIEDSLKQLLKEAQNLRS